MTLYPSATWRGPIPNRRQGDKVHPCRGLVLHVEVGTEGGTDSWFKNPEAKASADFGVAKSGAVDQWVDCLAPTSDKAWAQAAYNPNWFSVETEGKPTEPLTDAQVQSIGELLAWLHNQEGFPLQVTDNPAGYGLITHGAFGSLGGGHFDCPGSFRSAQRHAIVDIALRIVGSTPLPSPGEVMSRVPNAVGATKSPTQGFWVFARDGGVFSFGGAPFFGSVPQVVSGPLQAPVIAMVPYQTTGYWLVSADTGVFGFGSVPAISPYLPMVQTEYRRGDRAIVGVSYDPDPDGTPHLLMMADDGSPYRL